MLASSPCIIKASPKSDMAIIWIDIWDSQNGTKGKNLINRYFNIGKHIATICKTNMNPGIFQCKNCWKWGHTTFACHSHRSKCQKCNGPYKVKYHRDLAWCCKTNLKIDSPDSKLKLENHALTLSNASIARVNILLMMLNAHFGGISSTTSSTQRKHRKPAKSGPTQST